MAREIEIRRQTMTVFMFIQFVYYNSLNLKKNSTMDLEAFLQQQPLEKLVSTYIELQLRESGQVKQRSRKEFSLVNSILVSVVQSKKGLTQLFAQINCSLQANENDRKCMQRAGQLLLQITKKSPHLINQSAQTLFDIVVLCCQKAHLAACGNVFIQLLHHLTTTNTLNSEQITIEVVRFLTSPKTLPSTYRQTTRLSLYKLYLHVLQKVEEVTSFYCKTGKEFNRSGFIERCISNGSGEKDPRNIGVVFELYLKALEVFKPQQLIKYKSEMFENLQSYYPIEFVGDEQNEEHKKVNLKHISRLLDECLTHPFFVQQSWDLLNAKTVAAPIAPFVPTFLLYLQKVKSQLTPQLSIKLKNILFRLSQQQFIAEDYPQGQPDLGNLLTKILDTIFGRTDGSYAQSSFETVMNWLDLMLGKVVNGHCKHSGTMMGIFRSIVRNGRSKRGKTLSEIFRVHALRSVINVLSPQNEIVPKLGLAIVALNELESTNSSLSELMALLTLKVGKLYPEVTDQLKMLLLKILLEIYEGCPEAKAMVRKVNDSYILKDCLARAKQAFQTQLDPTETYLVKAFIDYISVVYPNETDTILENVLAANYQLQTYLLGRLTEGLRKDKSLSSDMLTEKLKKIVEKINFLIVSLKEQTQKQSMVKALSAISEDSRRYLLRSADWFSNQQNPKLIFGLLLQLKKHLRNSQIIDESSTQSQSNLEFFEAIFRNKDIQHQSDSFFQSLWKRLNKSHNNQTLLSNLKSQNFVFSSEFLEAYPPTLIHWLWQNYSQIQDKTQRQNKSAPLIQHLPQKLLLRDSKQVLQTAINSEGQVNSLVKVVKNLDWQTLKQTGIIDYSLGYLDQLCKNEESKNKQTQQSVCMLSILICILQKQQEHDQFKKALVSRKKAIKGLLQHRKRPLRQAVRKLLLILQE